MCRCGLHISRRFETKASSCICTSIPKEAWNQLGTIFLVTSTYIYRLYFPRQEPRKRWERAAPLPENHAPHRIAYQHPFFISQQSPTTTVLAYMFSQMNLPGTVFASLTTCNSSNPILDRTCKIAFSQQASDDSCFAVWSLVQLWKKTGRGIALEPGSLGLEIRVLFGVVFRSTFFIHLIHSGR